MSYRAFKRLLGETSLERKCRFLFGAGTLLLITDDLLVVCPEDRSAGLRADHYHGPAAHEPPAGRGPL